MEQERNAGYTITSRLQVGESEFVMGERNSELAGFVTWKSRIENVENVKKEYFWGHYFNDRFSATEDLCRRAIEEIEYRRGLQIAARQGAAPETPGSFKDQEECFEGLPEYCYSLLAITEEGIIIERGAQGYTKTDIGRTSQEHVDHLNEQIGVNKGQARAMEEGLSFGWQTPEANPKLYDEKGEPKKSMGLER